MVKVTLNDTVLAESDKTIVVENNHYFPPDSLKVQFTPSTTITTCSWKGDASYYNVTVGDQTVKDVAWYYPNPKEKAKSIQNYVAFYKNKIDSQA